MIQSPLALIEIVHHADNLSFIKPVVAEPLPDVSPVLLLDMGVIIAVIRTGAGKLNRFNPISEVAPEMMVYEFTAVISVEAEYREWHARFNVFKSG